MAKREIVSQRPSMRMVGSAGVTFEFWLQAGTEREAVGGARSVLREACRAAGVGDPAPPRDGGTVDVMLVFEEVPTVHRDQG